MLNFPKGSLAVEAGRVFAESPTVAAVRVAKQLLQAPDPVSTGSELLTSGIPSTTIDRAATLALEALENNGHPLITAVETALAKREDIIANAVVDAYQLLARANGQIDKAYRQLSALEAVLIAQTFPLGFIKPTGRIDSRARLSLFSLLPHDPRAVNTAEGLLILGQSPDPQDRRIAEEVSAQVKSNLHNLLG